ncbi:MAG: amino acid transporter [Halobacteriaceae archaeon]
MLAIAGFVALNLLGARATGATENLLVGGKVAILLVMGVGGLWYGATHDELEYGIAAVTDLSLAPIMAAAVSFVAFQGWQLLYYDQERITDPVATIRNAVYIAIPAAVALYVVVAITTLSLAPSSIIRTHPERALAVAADPFLPYGYVIISLAAILSTGSAINATLFSSGYFAKGLLSEDFLPDRVGDASTSGIPYRTVLLFGVVTAGFTIYGSLGAITSFASLSFIIVFGGMSALALTHRHREDVTGVIPGVGVAGASLFFGLLLLHLYRAEPQTLVAVLGIGAVVVTAEVLYFERAVIEREVDHIEDRLTD